MSHTRSIRTRGLAALAAAGMILALGGCATNAGAGVTTLNFFQFKGEALEDFNKIIADFEAENPDIKVVQNQVADADTMIRTLLVKEQGAGRHHAEREWRVRQASPVGRVLRLLHEPVLGTINPSVQKILADLGNKQGEVNGLGYVNNANGVIYNQEIFDKLGLEVPQTWDEFDRGVRCAQGCRHHPVLRHARRFVDRPSVVQRTGAYVAQGDFFDKMRAEGENVGPDSEVSFQKDFADAMDQQYQLLYMQDGYRGKTYDDGNAAFANGKVAMLLQGIWAISPVKAVNPNIKAGIFPYPATDNPDDRLLVSGVDVVVTMGKNTPHKKEAMRFIDYLFQKNVIEDFAASQNMVPSVKGAKLSDEPALQSVKPYFDQGKITGFIDTRSRPASRSRRSTTAVPLQRRRPGGARHPRQRVGQGRRPHDPRDRTLT